MARPLRITRGFTLIELLIVVVILSTLAAIVVPQFASSSDSAKESAARSSLNGIRSALQMYRADKGTYPTASSVSVCTGVTQPSDDADALDLALRLYSNPEGKLCNAPSASGTDYNHGPYLRVREFPTNPLKGNNDVSISTANTLGVTASGDAAWRYQPATGEIIINDAAFEKY